MISLFWHRELMVELRKCYHRTVQNQRHFHTYGSAFPSGGMSFVRAWFGKVLLTLYSLFTLQT